MADTRHIQTLDKILEALGGIPPGSPTLFGMAALNSTVSLNAARLLTIASNISETNRQLGVLNTTASLIAYRLPGLRFSHPAPNEIFSAAVANPAAGNNTLQSAPIGQTANIIHKIRMQFSASHVSPGKDISFRDGAAGATYFTTRIPQGTSSFEIDLASPVAQSAATAAVCFVATGFSAVGNYEVLLSQKVPTS